MKKLTKRQRRELQREKVKSSLLGTGLYIYENNTSGDLSLPKATASGQRTVGPRGRFQGDSYFKQWVGPPNNLLRFIDEVIPAKEQTMEKKLILDQPDVITPHGKAENKMPEAPIHDNNIPTPGQDVLINEEPLDGVEIIFG